MAGGTLWRERQIASSLGKTECAHGEGVSGWRKQGGETQSGTGSAMLLELGDLKEQVRKKQAAELNLEEYDGRLWGWLNPGKH